MSYFGLVWAGLWRQRTRTILTLLAILVAFMLFGVLQGVSSAFNRLIDSGRLDVLRTESSSGFALPLAALPQIQRISGVTAVGYQSGFMGYFQSKRNLVPIYAVDSQRLHLTMLGNFKVPKAELADFKRTRTGALISARLARKLRWKIGDQVPVRAVNSPRKDGSIVWTFNIVGIYRKPSNLGQLGLVMHYRYFDTARAGHGATVQFYFEKIADSSEASEIANAIDDRFVNSAHPTHTDTERGYLQTGLSQLGNLAFFVDAIIGAAFATLVLVTGSNMMQSFQERVPEFAVLKTMGFSDGTLAMLVMGEAGLLCCGAAAIGLGLVAVLLGEAGPASGGNIPSVRLSGAIVGYGIVAAAVIALSSTSPAAWRLKRLSIVDALAAQ